MLTNMSDIQDFSVGAHAVAIQTDGKIDVAGYAEQGTISPSYLFGLVRYNANGSLDAAFGSGGIVVTPQFGGGADSANAMALQSDGKIVLAGQVNSSLVAIAAARYTTTGQLDTTFNGSGIVTLPGISGYTQVANGVVVQNSGGIVLAGETALISTSVGATTLVRLTTAGTLDTSFGSAGTGIYIESNVASTNAFAIAQHPNGDLLTCGRFTLDRSNPATNDMLVEAYLPSGTPDTTFGTGGAVTIDFSGSDDRGRAIAVQPDGKIVALAASAPAATRNYAIALARLTLAAPASQLVITNLSATSLAAGNSVTFTLTAVDSTGTAVPGYTGTAQLTSTDGRAVAGAKGLPASYTFVGSDNGAHTFTVMLATPGSQTITATDQANNGLTATTSPIMVSAGPFSEFVVSTPSGNALVAGNPFLFTVQATDSFGNPVTSYSGPASVTAAATPADPQSNFPITGTLNNSGIGLFLGNLKTAGSYALTTTAGTFSGASASLTVTSSAANYFSVTVPAAATTGSSFNVTVTAFDHFGNIATSYSGTVKLTSTDSAAGTLVGSYTFTTGAGKDNGVHTFSTMLKTGGSQAITATDASSTNPAITGTSSAITTRGLTVTAFTPTATGFTVTFSKPIVAADVSLYDGTVASPIQNVTLVGTSSGPVTGTFVIDPSSSSATFKASSTYLQTFFQESVLPNDTWKATLASGTGTGATANGFFDALGAALDGANNAGHANYTTTFTTANDGKPALSIPDFARGPDGSSTIKVPNDSGKGIPVTLSNVPAGSGVTDVVFTLSYNPTLFDPTGGGTGDSSGTGSTFVMGTRPSMPRMPRLRSRGTTARPRAGRWSLEISWRMCPTVPLTNTRARKSWASARSRSTAPPLRAWRQEACTSMPTLATLPATARLAVWTWRRPAA